MENLSDKTCIPCQGNIPPLQGQALNQLAQQLSGGWKIVNGHHLEKEYLFKDFKTALHFTNLVGQLAEQINHHPDLHLSWGKVIVQIWTHKINGLVESDFIFAAKCDKLPFYKQP
jgi:4a-hydroxytetrahydrobiopterin dehydratase